MAEGAVRGSCLCGGVAFEVRPPTQVCAHCHCSMCRRAHGAAFVTWVRLPKTQLQVISGGDQLVQYQSSKEAHRSFCRVCGSSLFFESRAHPETIDVCLAHLEGPIDRRPQVHVFFDDRVSWVEVGDDLPRLGGKSGVEPIKSG